MLNCFRHTFFLLLLSIAGILIFNVTESFAFDGDLSIGAKDVRATSQNLLVGETVRIYATVHNNSYYDLFGVVKLYDESTQAFISTDQPVSVLAQNTDDVFVDWTPQNVGNHPIAVRVVPWNKQNDNPNNNKITKIFYVDRDYDSDGIGDQLDTDDDNDGVPDDSDKFPYDPSESKDSDGDGIGNNADTDDDNDGVSDIQDAFPLDPNESSDRDGDGVGDNTDIFPDDPTEWQDADEDGLGDNADPNDQNHGPIPQIDTVKTTVTAGKIVTFNALKSRDPDGEIVTYDWDLGDGTQKTGVVIDHVFEKQGVYDVTLTVTDDQNEKHTKTLTINVVYKWQTIALFASTLLLILLLLIGWLLKRKKKEEGSFEFEEKIHSIPNKTKKGLRKKSK